MLSENLAQLAAKQATIQHPRTRIQYQRVITKASHLQDQVVKEQSHKGRKRHQKFSTGGGIGSLGSRRNHQGTEENSIDLGQPSIISYEAANSKSGGGHSYSRRTNGQGLQLQMMHMIPTTAHYRSYSKHNGGGEYQQMVSIDSMGEPMAISPRFAHNGMIIMPNSNKSSDQMIDLGIRDSRLTNIVLDDFRKQVKGLELQVGNSPLSRRSPINSRKAVERSFCQRHSPQQMQQQESTDLDESRPHMARIQPKSGVESYGFDQLAVKNSISIKKSPRRSALGASVDDVMKENPYPPPDEKIISAQQIQEMKRRLQQRQRGIKSQENSYLTKLDPNSIVQHQQYRYLPQQHQKQVAQQITVFRMTNSGELQQQQISSPYQQATNQPTTRQLHSMNGNRQLQQEPTVVLPPAKNQNQFIKSFVQNKKNSSMFTQFMARASNSNGQQAQNTTNLLANQLKDVVLFQQSLPQPSQPAPQAPVQATLLVQVSPKALASKSPDKKQLKSQMASREDKIKIQQNVSRRTSAADIDQRTSKEARTNSLTEISAEGASTFGNTIRYATLKLDKNAMAETCSGAVGVNEKNAQTSFIMKDSKIDTDSFLDDATPTQLPPKRISQQSILQTTTTPGPLKAEIATGIERQQTGGITQPPAMMALNIQHLQSYDNASATSTMLKSGLASPHFAGGTGAEQTNREVSDSNQQSARANRVSVPLKAISPQKLEQKKPVRSLQQSPQQKKETDRKNSMSPPVKQSINRKKQTLASLVSVTSLSRVNEEESASQTKRKSHHQAPVNVKIKLMTSQESEGDHEGDMHQCTCNQGDHQGAAQHKETCDLARSESQQVLQSVNSRFQKNDKRAVLARKEEKRQNKLLYPDHPHLRQRTQGSRLRFAVSHGLPQCDCQGKPCCTVVQKGQTPSTFECNCVQHSYKYQISTRDTYTMFAGRDISLGQLEQLMPSVTESGGSGIISQKRILHGRHHTVDRWNSTGKYKSQQQGRGGGPLTAIASSRKEKKVNLTQALTGSEGGIYLTFAKRGSPVREARILESKLPSLAQDNFSSEQLIAGARVTFIEQLKNSATSSGQDSREKESQSELYRRFVGSQEAIPRNFKQIISDARNSSHQIDSRRSKQFGGLDSENSRFQSIFSARGGAGQVGGGLVNCTMSSKFQQAETSSLLAVAEQRKNSLAIADGAPPSLSVKKQLRLQKMALQGINYRPNQQQKIFTKDDITEYFKDSLEKHQVINSVGENSDALLNSTKFVLDESQVGPVDSQLGDSIFEEFDRNMISEFPSQENLPTSNFRQPKLQYRMTANSGAILVSKNSDVDVSDPKASIVTANNSVRECVNQGQVTFGTVAKNDSIQEETPASISSYTQHAYNSFKTSKETVEWINQEEKKKLLMSRKTIKKLTADPIMSIEQTKAKNNKAMLKKIQKKVDQMQTKRASIAQRRFLIDQSSANNGTLQQEDSVLSSSLSNKRKTEATAAAYNDYMANCQKVKHQGRFSSTNDSLWNQRQSTFSKTVKHGGGVYAAGATISDNEELVANSRAAGAMGNSLLFQPMKAQTAPWTSPHATLGPRGQPPQAIPSAVKHRYSDVEPQLTEEPDQENAVIDVEKSASPRQQAEKNQFQVHVNTFNEQSYSRGSNGQGGVITTHRKTSADPAIQTMYQNTRKASNETEVAAP